MVTLEALTLWLGRSLLICWMVSLMYWILFVMYSSRWAMDSGSIGSSVANITLSTEGMFCILVVLLCLPSCLFC